MSTSLNQDTCLTLVALTLVICKGTLLGEGHSFGTKWAYIGTVLGKGLYGHPVGLSSGLAQGLIPSLPLGL